MDNMTTSTPSSANKATFIELAISNYISTYYAPPCARVNQVVSPNAAREYGVIADLDPHISPGVLQILLEGTEKYDTSLPEVSLSPILIPPL